MKTIFNKALWASAIGACTLSLGSCTDLSETIYDTIASQSQISLDDLSEKLDIPPYKLLPILLDFELKGYIKALSGKQYSII